MANDPFKQALDDAFKSSFEAGTKTTDPEFDVAFKDAMQASASPITPSMVGRQKGSPDYERGRAEQNPVERGLVNVIQGPTLGFGDEIMGGLGAVIDKVRGDNRPLSERYSANRDYYRGVADQYREDFPTGSWVTQAAASAPLFARDPLTRVASPVLSTAFPKTSAAYGNWIRPSVGTTGIIPQMTHSAITGAGYGGITGAGESRSTTAGGVIGDAILNAGLSAMLGAGTQAGSQAIQAGANRAAQTRIGQEIANSRIAQKVLGDFSANNFAQQKVAEAISRDAPDVNVRMIPQSERTANRMDLLGPESRVVDAAGANTRQLLDTVATLPGRTKNQVENAIHTRQAGRAGRLVSAADDALGTNAARYAESIDLFDQARRQAAAPLYQQVNSVMVRVDDDVARLLSRTEPVHRDAERLFLTETGNKLDLSKLQVGDQVPFATLDYIKRSLYDAASTAKRSGSNTMGRAYDDVRTSLISKLDDISPKDRAGNSIYQAARDAWAGPSQLIDAAEIGRRAMRGDSMELAREIRGMAQSEIEAMRIGALQAIREKAGTMAGQTSLLNMWKEPATRDRLQTVFGGNYKEFASAVAKEARMKPLETVGRGSQTSARGYGAGDLDMAVVSDLAQAGNAAMSGSPVGAVMAARNAWNRVATPEPVRDEIGRLLLSRDPATARNLTGLLEQVNASKMRQAGASGGFSGLLSQEVFK